ncbi:MAG: 2OG-Fe(II) oxygenase [Gammaproteobacteria bacterium]|nr:2OG-Fe(II) oxygenase [Gammaproteobacteria bacterium]
MSTTYLTQAPTNGDVFDRISEALKHQGYIVLDEVFTVEQLQSLFIDIKQTDSENFHQAGIGREQVHQLNPFVRRDRICWLDMSHPPTRFYLQWAEQLRLHLNRALFLGLFDYESHYAHYFAGAFYKKHLDVFKDDSSRRLSSILYLNPAWQPGDGGELVLYAPDDSRVLETVSPAFGAMVVFLSEEFPHEVLPTRCSRYSLTGWYRVNATTAVKLDPPA